MTREEAISQLQEAHRESLEADDESERTDAVNKILAIIPDVIDLLSSPRPPSQEEKAVAWISIKERMPDEQFILMAGTASDGVAWRDVGVYRGDGQFVDKYSSDSFPTHWTHLPVFPVPSSPPPSTPEAANPVATAPRNG